MKCEACGRALKKFAVEIRGADGVAWGFGPVCAKAVTVSPTRSDKGATWAERARPVQRDTLTRDWVNEAAQAA